jgi:hypothetical protein
MIRILAHPITPPPFRQLVVSLSSSCVSPVQLTDGRGEEGVGEELNHTYDCEKDRPYINYSILSGFTFFIRIKEFESPSSDPNS